jgi:phosphoserine phosphatase RsbU/P
MERLASGGLPVGLLDGSEYEQEKVQLQPGDTLLCFSDGISEAINAKREMWSESEVEKIVRNCGKLTAQQTIDVLVDATNRFIGEAKQSDDMTVVAIRVSEGTTEQVLG